MTILSSTDTAIITICGWCPDAKELTATLTAQGKLVSHGLCLKCYVEINTRNRE